ncbi:hypothetical protein ACFQO4_20910 [Saliphagus sp. GCM10025334]
MTDIERWKVTNEEGFIPPVSYYESDRVAARAEAMPGMTVTIVGGVVDDE